ncbi:hypothetical protein [Paenibacillus thiaminolyticus]|uniref:hypothetical protein n=1 Tax=Paenibacillus thiaminolyticus TaxID=49283 RepID=UPI002543C8D3|nr:hypothetical protein [Paenibacillus thiaminolyticus]WII36802.1 hypothetical protein O0V01_24725 [Paenibacillus thiaminolyticus]
MNTITLYKWRNLQAVESWDVEEGFSLDYCGRYGFVDCDNRRAYVLPEGYDVRDLGGGDLHIYDDEGYHCHIEMHAGLPVLRSTRNGGVVLQPAEESEAVS